MPYRVKEIFRSICGEGHHIGRPAVFIRFAGCNLWSGREADRASAICPFCDTDFASGQRYEDEESLANASLACWGEPSSRQWCVLTGGEPALQVTNLLCATLRRRGFAVAIETNGTRPIPRDWIHWVTVSPKAGAPLALRGGDELKLVFPQAGIDPADYVGMPFDHFFLQPMDGPDREVNTRVAIEYVLAHPQWRLSEQRHKAWGLR